MQACSETIYQAELEASEPVVWGVTPLMPLTPHRNFCITEKLLDWSSSKGTTMGKDAFDSVSDSISQDGKSMCSYWSCCMLGCYSVLHSGNQEVKLDSSLRSSLC